MSNSPTEISSLTSDSEPISAQDSILEMLNSGFESDKGIADTSSHCVIRLGYSEEDKQSENLEADSTLVALQEKIDQNSEEPESGKEGSELSPSEYSSDDLSGADNEVESLLSSLEHSHEILEQLGSEAISNDSLNFESEEEFTPEADAENELEQLIASAEEESEDLSDPTEEQSEEEQSETLEASEEQKIEEKIDALETASDLDEEEFQIPEMIADGNLSEEEVASEEHSEIQEISEDYDAESELEKLLAGAEESEELSDSKEEQSEEEQSETLEASEEQLNEEENDALETASELDEEEFQIPEMIAEGNLDEEDLATDDLDQDISENEQLGLSEGSYSEIDLTGKTSNQDLDYEDIGLSGLEVEVGNTSEPGSDLQENISQKPSGNSPFDIKPALWLAAASAVHQADIESAMELSMADIAGFENNATTNLLFHVVREELAGAEEASIYATKIDKSTEAKVVNKDVKQAVNAFSKQVKEIKIAEQKAYERSIEIDTSSPWEGVVGASLFKRIGAFLIDGAITLGVASGLTVLIFARPGLLGDVMAGNAEFSELATLFGNAGIVACGFWLIYNIFKITFDDRTIGQKIFGLRVSGLKGESVGAQGAFLRALSQLACVLTGGLSMLPVLGKKKLALHDKISWSVLKAD